MDSNNNESCPLTSVGMSVYNRGKDFEQSLNSIINQSYENLEILFSDNNSNYITKEICEFNSIFGKKISLTTPYEKKFIRSQKHYSHLYFGYSIKDLVELARKKGYIFLDTNLNGNNAFFVRSNCIKLINSKLQNIKIHQAKFRESRNLDGRLNYKDLDESLDIIEELPILNLADGSIDKIINLKKSF